MDDFLDSEEYKQYVKSYNPQDDPVKAGLICQICQKPRAADGSGAVITNNRPDDDNTRYHCLSCYANAFQMAMEYAKILNEVKAPTNIPDDLTDLAPPKRRRTVQI